MIDNTINGSKTIVASGKGAILPGRYHIIRQLGQGGVFGRGLFEIRMRDAML